jgi:hypothetical protein
MLLVLPKVMAKSAAFDLKTPLILWNFILALFSIVGSFYVIPPAYQSITEEGLNGHLCTAKDENVFPSFLNFF